MASKTDAGKKIDIKNTEDTFGDSVAGWKATLFNCDCHDFDEVILQLIKATNCSHSEASQNAKKVHFTGSAVVYRGTKQECERVASILGSIGLLVDVSW